MTNKTKLFSFILFSISTVFLIISIVFFYLFNQAIPKTYEPAHMCIFFTNNCVRNYYILNSNIQKYYLPGLIFNGISLFLTITGVILFRVYLFRKRSINKEQVDKETKFNDNTHLLENSFVIFIVVIAFLLISIVYFIRLQRRVSEIFPYIYSHEVILTQKFNLSGILLFPRSLSLQTISSVLSYRGLVNIFYGPDILLLHDAEMLVTISVILSIIGIVLFANSFFVRNKVRDC